jgi:hypothetical protein
MHYAGRSSAPGNRADDHNGSAPAATEARISQDILVASLAEHLPPADGRSGAYWWHWCDDAHGVIRADGTERPFAGVLRAFANASPAAQRANEMPMISSTYYYRTCRIARTRCTTPS